MATVNDKIQKGFLTAQDMENNGTPVPFFPVVRQQDIFIHNKSSVFGNLNFYRVKSYIDNYATLDNGIQLFYRTFSSHMVELDMMIPITLDNTFFKVPSIYSDPFYCDDYSSITNYRNKYRSNGFFYAHDGSNQPIKTSTFSDRFCSITSPSSGPTDTYIAYRPYVQQMDSSNNNRNVNYQKNNEEAGWWKGTGNASTRIDAVTNLVSCFILPQTLFTIRNRYNLSIHITSDCYIVPVLSTASPNLYMDGNKVFIIIHNERPEFRNFGMIYIREDQTYENYSGTHQKLLDDPSKGLIETDNIPGIKNGNIFIQAHLELEVE